MASCDPCTLPDNTEVNRHYQPHASNANSDGAGLGAGGIAVLRQTSMTWMNDKTSTKLRTMVSIVAALPPGTKFIVFSQWPALLHAAMAVLENPASLQGHDDEREGAGAVNGSGFGGSKSNSLLPPTKSVILQLGLLGQKAVEEFREDPEIRALMVCTKAGHGASGLNLTNAHHAIILEPSMDAGLEQQAIGRVHRLGQEHDVVVHRLFAKNTIENSIQVVQERRRRMFESRATEIEDVVTTSNTREIMEMFDVLHLLS
jgi:hypothetical protein